MTIWKSDELYKIGTAEELQIASLRKDGMLRKPVTIWVVRVGDDLYIRAYKGRSSPWFRGVQASHEGQIRARGVVKDVTFTEIDEAYRSKYRRYTRSILDSMVTPAARAATLKLVSQGDSSHDKE